MWNKELNALLPKWKRGKAFVLSGPAGSGKTTLVDMLNKEDGNCIKNVSYTTRAPREGEEDGVDYFFISESEFQEKVQKGDFLEHINLFGYSYGTSHDWIEKQQAGGKNVVLVIDTQGALKIRHGFDAAYIFVRPPSLEVLVERLNKRHSESKEQIQERVLRATHEVEQAKHYDYEMVNDDLGQAYQVFKSIVIAELHRSR